MTTEQRTVLQAIYDYFHEHGDWPTFITIDRPLRRQHGWDAAAIVLGLPESLIVQPRSGSLRPVAEDVLRLQLPGIEACRGGSEDTARFVRLLRWLAEREMAYEPGPQNPEFMPRVTSEEVSQHLGLGDEQLALKRLYTMLQLDGWGLTGRSGSGDAFWYVTLGPEIWRFRDVQTLDDCIEVRDAWQAEGRRKIGASSSSVVDYVVMGNVAAEGPVMTAVPASYVDQRIVAAIRAKEGSSRFEVTKLLTLIEELNDNYARKNTYAAHALLRAVLDHVPPILGYAGFTVVANNYAWPRTDKKYIQRLEDFRAQADDALHRQISAKADVLDFDDLPASVCVDRLLQECADKL